MDGDQFRALLRNHAGAVAVIAVGHPGARTGLTATAVNSLSDQPPAILACINQRASAHEPILAAGAFSVNFLRAADDELATVFAGQTDLRGEDRFRSGAWGELSTGAPVLKSALLALDCRLIEHHRFSTHTVMIGAVADGRYAPEADPLLYFRGDFCSLATAEREA